MSRWPAILYLSPPSENNLSRWFNLRGKWKQRHRLPGPCMVRSWMMSLLSPHHLSFSVLQIRRVNKEGRMDEGPREQGGPEQPGGNKWWHSSIWVKKEGMTLIHFLADGGVWSRNEVIIAADTTVQYRLALRKRHRGGRFIINRVFVCVRLPVVFVFICFYSSLVHVCVSSWNLLPKSLCKNDIYLSCRWQQQVSTQIRSMEINIIITAHTAHIHKENSTHCYENKGFVWNWLLV